jgi:hypothetical protein
MVLVPLMPVIALCMPSRAVAIMGLPSPPAASTVTPENASVYDVSPLAATPVTPRSAVIFNPGRFIGIAMPPTLALMPMLIVMSIRPLKPAGTA